MTRKLRDIRRNFPNPFVGLTFSPIALTPGSNGFVFIMESPDGQRFVMKAIDKKRKREKDLEGTEEAALRRVKSDFVIPLLERIEDKRYKYFRFPFVEGNDLNSIIDERKEPFSNEEIMDFAKQMAQAIIDMNSAGVIHQDIKPKNIRLTPQGRYMVLDLGIARFKETGKRGVTRGAYGYSSPEQIYGAIEAPNRPPTTFSADHWAIGTIMYQMATLQHPFGMEERRAMNDPVVDPRKFNPKLDQRLAEIIIRLLKKSASERYLKPEQLLAALNGEAIEVPPIFEGKGTLHSYRKTRVSRDFVAQYRGKVSQTERLPGGFVLPRLSMAKDMTAVERLRAQGYHFIIDPETYYAFLKSDSGDTKRFFRQKNKDALIKEVLGVQQDNGADYFISPYFYIDNVDGDELSLTPAFYEESLKLLRDAHITTPLLGGLFIGRSVLANDASRKRLLDELLPATDGLAGIYLIAETTETGSDPVRDRDFLRSLRNLIETLSQKLPVVLGYADVFALGLIPSGLSAMVTHPYSSARKINVPQMKKNILARSKEKKKFGGMTKPPEQFYAPNLLNFVRVTGELDEILAGEKGEELVGCSCPFCSPELFQKAKTNPDILRKSWSESDRFNHYMFSITEGVSQMKALPESKARQSFLERIERAKELYRRLGKMELHEHSRGDFLDAWKESFS